MKGEEFYEHFLLIWKEHLNVEYPEWEDLLGDEKAVWNIMATHFTPLDEFPAIEKQVPKKRNKSF